MASALEQFVNTVRTLSSQGNTFLSSMIMHSIVRLCLFTGTYRELLDYLSKSNEVLVKNVQHLDNVLETLDLQQHTLGVLAVLTAKCSALTVTSATDNRFAQVQEFIFGCNGELIRLAPDTCKNLFLIRIAF